MLVSEIVFVLAFAAIALWRGSWIWKIIGGLTLGLWALREAGHPDFALPLLAGGLYMIIDAILTRKGSSS